MVSGRKREQADIALSDQAIEWLVLLHSGKASEADRADFRAWSEQSVDHALAAEEAETIWHGLGVVGNNARSKDRARRRVTTRRALLGSAGLVLVGAAAYRTGLLGPAIFADYITGTGEQRTETLPDGSTVRLNAKTALSVDFTAGKRSLVLHYGQATFTVAHDTARPFVVAAANGWTQAIGTVFDVDMRPAEIVVTVVEGTVAVSTNDDPGERIMASADHQVRYVAGQIAEASTVDAASETAWRRGKLIFHGKSLGDVIAEIRRYRGGEIVILNNRLRALKVTGVFDLSDPDAILQTIEATLPVRVSYLPLVTILR
jgi:transmembrane sensor